MGSIRYPLRRQEGQGLLSVLNKMGSIHASPRAFLMQRLLSVLNKMGSILSNKVINWDMSLLSVLNKMGSILFFLCLARIFLPLSHIGTTPRGCGTKKLKYSCLLCGRRKESPGFFFAGMQRRGPGMKKCAFLSLKSSRLKISHSPFFD